MQPRQQDRQDVAAAAADDEGDGDDGDAEDEDDLADDGQQNDDAATSVPRPRRKTANVGSAALLDCDVAYPPSTGDSYVQHIVTWRKQGVEAPVFIAFDGYPPRRLDR